MKKRLIFFLREQQTFFFAFVVFFILGLVLQLQFDQEEIFLFINQHYNDFWDSFFVVYTWLGDGLTVVTIALLLGLYKFRYTVLSLVSYLYTSFWAQLLKFQFHMPRPLKYFEGKEDIRVIEGVDVHLYKSFPSGHSVSALAFATILAYIIPNKKVGWLIFLVYLLAAFSRVYLAEHFFIDIYAGGILGVLFSVQVVCWLEGQKWFNSPYLDKKLDTKLFKKDKKRNEFDLTYLEKILFGKH